MDMSQYQDLFFEEAAEHLQTLNQNILALENNPERLDLMDSIFRAAHTLKGMSATMGFDAIAQLTHQIENLLDKLREKKIELSPAIFNCLFKSADALENMLESIRGGSSPDIDLKVLSEELASLEKGEEANVINDRPITYKNGNGSEFNEYEKNILNQAAEKNLFTWKIKVEIDEACVMKGVRAFMVFQNLENIGEIIKSIPHVQDIEDEKFNKEIILFLITKETLENVKKNLDSISEVKIVEIEEVKTNFESETIKEQDIIQKNTDTLQNTLEKKQKSHQTVRVDINRLDKLMSLVGELVINKTRLEQINISGQTVNLNETIEQINRITADLQSVVQNVRMVSIEQVFNRFPRMVRDLAKELGKEINLIMEGKETELDRTVIDEIGDPLVHLIRNALDHGLEPSQERLALNKNVEGMIRLSAKQEGNQVIISVEDDGRGLDIDSIKRKAVNNGFITPTQLENIDESVLLNLIFEAGFSTAQNITDISGRGVGLDVVRSKIQSLSGNVSVETKPGQGTRFVVKLPLTLAIIQALLVKVQDETFAIPLANIDETTSLEFEQIKKVQEQQVVVLRGKVLPLLFMKSLLSVPGDLPVEEMFVVVVRKGEQQIGLVVEELIGQQEIVINSLGKLLSGIPGIAGASILGDGRVSLILDIGTLF